MQKIAHILEDFSHNPILLLEQHRSLLVPSFEYTDLDSRQSAGFQWRDGPSWEESFELIPVALLDCN